MSQEKSRQDEFYALALSARRRDSKVSQRDTKGQDPDRPSVPTPQEDALTEFIRCLAPWQRELFGKWLNS